MTRRIIVRDKDTSGEVNEAVTKQNKAQWRKTKLPCTSACKKSPNKLWPKGRPVLKKKDPP